jgi:hypothetical protein
MDVSDLLAITLKKNWKIKVAEWGNQKKTKKLGTNSLFWSQNSFLRTGCVLYNYFC